MKRARLLLPLLLTSVAVLTGFSGQSGLAESGTETLEAQRRRIQRLPAHYAAFQSKDDDKNMSRAVLRNGLTIVVEEQAIRPLAAIVTYVKAGFLQEGELEKGAAHALAELFQEHSQAALRLRRAGGWLSARAAPDHLVFTALAPADNVLDAVEISSQLLQAPGWAAQPLSSLTTSPSAAAPAPAEKRVWELAYPERGLRMAAGGADTTPSLDGLLSFHKAHFTPAGTILTVSGTVNRELVLKEIVEHYASIQGEGRPAPSPVTPTAFDPEKTVFSYGQQPAGTDPAALILAYRVPGPNDPDAPAVEILSAVLGTGRGSLLRLLVSSGAALEAEAQLTALPGGGLLRIAILPAVGQLDRVEVEAVALISRLAEQPPGSLQLNRAKALLVKRHYQKVSSLQGRAFTLADREAKGGYKSWKRIPEQIAAVSPSQVQKAAERYFRNSNLTLIESLPAGSEARTLSTEKFLETLGLLIQAGAEEAQAAFQVWQGQGEEPNFQLPDFQPNLVKKPLKRTSVLRGPRIFLEEEHLVPLLQAGFFFAGGRIEEEKATAGLTELMWRSLLRGIDTGAGPEAWRRLEKHGAEFKIVNEPDFHGLQVSLLSSGLPDLLATVVGWLREPQITAENVAFEIERMKAEAVRDDARPWTKVFASIQQGLFEDHPYARNRLGSAESRSQLEEEMVRSWASNQLTQIHPVIVLRGDLAGTSFLPPLLRVLGNSKMGQKPPVIREAPIKKNLVTASDSGCEATGLPGPARGTRDAWTVEVLQSLVYLWSGFTPPAEDARTEPSPRLSARPLLGGGSIYVTHPPLASPEVSRRHLEKAAALKGAAIRKQDVLQSIVLTITRFYDGRQHGEAYLTRLAESLVAGEKPAFQAEYLATLKGVQVEDIRDFSGRYLRAPPPQLESLEATPPAQARIPYSPFGYQRRLHVTGY